MNDWAKSMDRGFRTDIAIFDFSKAFDSAPHCHWFSKLSQYGICGTVQNWLHSFLSDRYSLIYINDIVLNTDSEIRLFVDDCIVYRQLYNSCDSVSLQSDINKR